MFKSLLILLLSAFLLFSCSKKNNEEVSADVTEEDLAVRTYAEAVKALIEGDAFYAAKKFKETEKYFDMIALEAMPSSSLCIDNKISSSKYNSNLYQIYSGNDGDYDSTHPGYVNFPYDAQAGGIPDNQGSLLACLSFPGLLEFAAFVVR